MRRRLDTRTRRLQIDDAVRVTIVSPCPELAPYVRSFSLVETDEAVTRALLPDTGIVLGIRYGGFARQIDGAEARLLPGATLAGMQSSARRMNTSARAGIVLATFRPAGAAAFFAEPLHELFGKTAPLDDFVPASDVERTRARVGSARSQTERVAAVERLLLDRLRHERVDRVVDAAVRAISDARGACRIGELSGDLRLSRERLGRRFRERVGAPPKQFASLIRIRHAIELHRSGTSLTDAAVEAGYFDQAHFIREFRLVTGEAPRRFFGGVEHC